MEKETIIVSRHPAAVEFIRCEAGLGEDVPVLASVTADDVRGKRVYGNLPLHLAAVASRSGEYWALEFDGAAPRGAEYTLDDMRAAGAKLVRYRVFTEEGYQLVVRAAAEWTLRLVTQEASLLVSR